jgi:hypothetical protein
MRGFVNTELSIPAEAGIHVSAARNAEGWALACAGVVHMTEAP